MLQGKSCDYRDDSIGIQQATMYWQSSRSFYMGLTSAEGQKLECFKWAANNIF